MAVRFPKLTFRPNMDLLQTILMFKGGFAKRRVNALMRYFSHESAKVMQSEVVSRIPEKPDYRSYRESLQLVQSGLPSKPVFSLKSMETSVAAEEVNKATDILYFKVKGKGRIDPGIAVLLQYQPWTQDTLPFTPPSSKAILKKRKVSKQEVVEVNKAREKDRPEWSRKLSEAGIRPEKPKAADIPASATAVPDMLYTALRLEFGLGGSMAVAHWRPGLQATKSRMLKLFKASKLDRVLLGWKDSRWQKWRDLRERPVDVTDANSFQGFQSKIVQ